MGFYLLLGNLLHDEGLQDIANLDVVETVETDATLVAIGHLLHVVLEATQRGDLQYFLKSLG